MLTLSFAPSFLELRTADARFTVPLQTTWLRSPSQVVLVVCSPVSICRIGRINDGLVDVAQEIIDVLVATKKHEILLLSRKVRVLHAASVARSF